MHHSVRHSVKPWHLANLMLRIYTKDISRAIGKEIQGYVMVETFLVAQDLHRSFNENKVVNGVSFTINKEVVKR